MCTDLASPPAAGDFSWMEAGTLGDRRTVMVTVPMADVHETADEHSAVVFSAEKGVILELPDGAPAPWLKVRHRDGATGYVRADQVWGS